MVFGPSYKGIPIVTATAVALYQNYGEKVGYAFSRKEEKDHAEGGRIVGTRLAGRVVIVDDFIETGTAIDESVSLIRRCGARPIAVVVCCSNVNDIERNHGIKLWTISGINSANLGI